MTVIELRKYLTDQMRCLGARYQKSQSFYSHCNRRTTEPWGTSVLTPRPVLAQWRGFYLRLSKSGGQSCPWFKLPNFLEKIMKWYFNLHHSVYQIKSYGRRFGSLYTDDTFRATRSSLQRWECRIKTEAWDLEKWYDEKGENESNMQKESERESEITEIKSIT